MKNMSKIILDLCGGTGAWSRPYKEAGYDVRLITLPDNDVMTYVPPDNVYGILAAPPCTMFSLARQNAKTPRDLRAGMETVRACLNIIWECRLSGSLKFWALENPRGYLRQFLGRPAFETKAWYFEDAEFEKPTDIWGYFNNPKIKNTTKPKMDYRQIRWQKPPAPKGYEHITDRAAIRSITPAGFANAFFRANP